MVKFRLIKCAHSLVYPKQQICNVQSKCLRNQLSPPLWVLSNPSFPLLQHSLCHGVVVPVKVPSMSQRDPCKNYSLSVDLCAKKQKNKKTTKTKQNKTKQTNKKKKTKNK